MQDMERLAERMPSLVFAACALGTSEDTVAEHAKVKGLLEDDTTPHLRHLFMSFPQKEEAKRVFAFSSVPHVVIFDVHGQRRYSGPPRNVESALREARLFTDEPQEKKNVITC